MLSRAKKPHHSTMRDFASCFSEHAVKVADVSCSGNSSSSATASSATAYAAADAPANFTPTDPPSSQSAITSLFRAKLSSGKPLLIKLTWCRSQLGSSLSICVDDNPEFSNPWIPNTMKSHLLRKKRGTHSFLAGSASIALHWDFSSARFGPGPEPIDKFYVAVTFEAEFALLLGDQSKEFLQRFPIKLPVAEYSVVCRREQVVGRSLHSTSTARFSDGGKDHEIIIRCRGGGGWDSKDAELSVCIDKKRVVHVEKLNWNFRGNQTIFIDGTPVDMMWDMHGWWFSDLAGHAVFLFRQRSTLESRLWLEEQGTLGFSLLIQAFKSS